MTRKRHFNSENIGIKEYRARTLLADAYPKFPLDKYDKAYVLKMARVVPVIFETAMSGSNGHKQPDRILLQADRLGGWLDGESIGELADIEGTNRANIYQWLYYFPRSLGKRVKIYDILHAADGLTPPDPSLLDIPEEPLIG